jgi:hypothetical protein
MTPNKLPSLNTVQRASEAHPASYSMGTGVLSSVVKRPGREADHSPPSSSQVTNEWRYNYTPPTYFHGADKDNFPFK